MRYLSAGNGILDGLIPEVESSLNDEIVACRIHPAIGVARLGNSPSKYFVGPEVPGRYDTPAGGYHDEAGRIARQAARFRIYGYNAAGEVVREITADDAEISWAVYLANKKAFWYRINLPLDIPEARGELDHPRSRGPDRNFRRNASMSREHPEVLVIDPGPRRIRGKDTNSDGGERRYHFDQGRFFDIPVPLGELRTDASGRLLVLGGFGNSGSTIPPPLGRITDIRSNNDWYDDTSDGPVEASVVLEGKPLPVTPAWVVAAPPNFAPGIRPIVSIYDLVLDAGAEIDPASVPAQPSFRDHIYPLFETFEQNQWVNSGFLRDFGWDADDNPIAAANMARLNDPSEANRPFRESILLRFRNADYSTMNFDDWPPYYGDGVDFPAKEPRQWLAVTVSQYRWLEEWAAGNFEADGVAKGAAPASVEGLEISRQPGAVDRAALEHCVGGSFKPGYEMPWIMRVPMLYQSPSRLRHGPRLLPDRPIPQRGRATRGLLTEPDYGNVMTSAIAFSPQGPFQRSGPGDITRWMAVPWQGDAASCRSAFEPFVDPFLPTFWPARVPNEVLTWESYQTVLNTGLDPSERQDAFRSRANWLRRLSPSFTQSLNDFNAEWHELGLVTRQPGPGDGEFPDEIFVEGPEGEG